MHYLNLASGTSTWLYLDVSHIWKKIQPALIIIIYISSGPKFYRYSESEVRNLTFHLWHHIWLYLCVLGIFQGKLDLHQSWWSIYYLDQNFTEILNLKSETQNSTHGIPYDHICVLAIFPRKFDLHQSWWSIYHLDWNLTEILNWKSETPNSTHGISCGHICVLAIFWRKLDLHQLWWSISSGSDVHRDSESEVRGSKFYQLNPHLTYLCSTYCRSHCCNHVLHMQYKCV